MSDMSPPTPVQGRLIPLFLKYFALIWVPSLILAGVLAYGYWEGQKQTVLEHYRIEAQHHVEGQAQLVRRVYRLIASNMHVLSHHLDLVHAAEGSPGGAEEVAHLFSDTMEVADIYDQAWLFNRSGKLVAHVRWHHGTVHAVSKGGGLPRDEVRKGLQLSSDHIRVVSLKVWRDEGQQAKLIARFITPVVDREGHQQGVLALGVRETELLSRALSETRLPGEHLMMHTAFPYWFDRQGGHLNILEPQQGITLPQRFPLVWQRIQEHRTGQFRDSRGLFSFEWVHPPAFLGSHGDTLRDWQIVSFVPETALTRAVSRQNVHIVVFTVIVVLLLAALAWSLAMSRVIRREKERVQAQALSEVRALSNRLIRVQEDERKEVSRTLHDDIGQILAAVRTHIATALRYCERDDGSRACAEVQEADRLTDMLMESVRRYMRSLRPGYLDELGLAAALEEMCSTWESREEVACHLSIVGDVDSLPEVVSLTVFRTVQEGLTNIARHAEASRVDIVLDVGSGGLRLDIVDDGRGFDLFQPSEGLGLVGMRERVQALNGHIRTESSPGHGAQLFIRIPL